MKRAIVLLGLVVTTTVVLGACVPNQKSLTIVGVITPEFKSPNSCTYIGEDKDYLARGLLDIGNDIIFGGEPNYWLGVQVVNHLLNNQDVHNGRLNTMDIILERVTINYEWMRGAEQDGLITRSYQALLLLEDAEEEVFIARELPAADDANATSAPVAFEAIPIKVGEKLTVLTPADANDVVLGVAVQLHGETLGGQDVSSNTFRFPVYLCSGCTRTACCTETSTPTDDHPPICVGGQDGGGNCMECDTEEP